MPMTMTAIRDRFPTPQRMHLNAKADAYCVGGAVCRTAFASQRSSGFPTGCEVAQALKALNPALSSSAADIFAGRILTANDYENFDAAWQTVAQAITMWEAPPCFL